MKLLKSCLIGFCSISCLHAVPTAFWSQSGDNSTVNGVLDGATVADHLGTNNYNGYIGELILMPTSPAVLASVAVVASGNNGVVTADAGDTFAGKRGFVGFCIDSATNFSVSTSLTQIYNYQAYNVAAAEARYIAANVTYYTPGGLKRAGYLMETFFATAHSGGDIDAAALQAAIWEVLYDNPTSVTNLDGDYYIRTTFGNATAQALATNVRNTANGYLTSAAAANWGGAGYNPANRVLYWQDATAIGNNQSVITLNPFGSTIVVPEPEAWILTVFASGLLLRRRRPLEL